MPVDNSVALGIKPPSSSVDAITNVAKSMNAIKQAAQMMGNGVGTAASMANAPGNSFAFNPNMSNK